MWKNVITDHGNNNQSVKEKSDIEQKHVYLLCLFTDLPVYPHHVTVFVVVGFADFFWREKQ